MHACKVEDNKNCEGPRQYLYLLTPFRFLHDCVLKSSLLFCYRSKKKISLNVRSNVNINLQSIFLLILRSSFFLYTSEVKRNYAYQMKINKVIMLYSNLAIRKFINMQQLVYHYPTLLVFSTCINLKNSMNTCVPIRVISIYFDYQKSTNSFLKSYSRMITLSPSIYLLPPRWTYMVF